VKTIRQVWASLLKHCHETRFWDWFFWMMISSWESSALYSWDQYNNLWRQRQ